MTQHDTWTPAGAVSRGERLTAGQFAVSMLPAWSAGQIQELSVMAGEDAKDARLFSCAIILLNALAGNHAAARARISEYIDNFHHLYPHDDITFESILIVSILAGQWDLAPRMLSERFGTEWCASVCFDTNMPPGQTVRWELDSDGKSRFHFNAWMLSRDSSWALMLGWTRMLSLFHDYTLSPDAERGSVTVSVGDGGEAQGLAPCEYRRGYFLVPDPIYLSSRGYAAMRDSFDAARIPWADRHPVAFWRGACTGQLTSDWRALPRVRLCAIARAQADARTIDAALTSLAGRDPETQRGIADAGLLGDFAQPVDFMRYKYQIDIDGNTNAWMALFQKLLTGSPVLKVRSPLDYRQWFYDDLIPWHNHVPVAAEMGDLIDKIAWLRAHDTLAQRIGENGLALAQKLTHTREIVRARATIGSAIRYFAGRAEIAIPLGEETGATRYLLSGWSGIVAIGSASGRFPLGAESRLRFPRPVTDGDMELRLSVAPGQSPHLPCRVFTTVNGVPIGDLMVTADGDSAIIVPGFALARAPATTIGFVFTHDFQVDPSLPAGALASNLLFAGIAMGRAPTPDMRQSG